MTTGITAIEDRKRALVTASDAHRSDLALAYYRYQARTQVARQVTNIIRNPFVLTGLGLVLLKLPWRRCYRMGGVAWRGWRFLMLLRRVFI